MNEEQKAQAFAVVDILAAHDVCVPMPLAMVQHGGGASSVPNLADETGAVEGVLHRVLERLVGEPVEVVTFYGLIVTPRAAPMWGARQPNSGRWFNDGQRYPSRLDAIVAALLALEVTT